MTMRRSERSSANRANPSYEMRGLHESQPPKTRITTAWEVINSAADRLETFDAILALTEITRRANENIQERLRKLTPSMRKTVLAMLNEPDLEEV